MGGFRGVLVEWMPTVPSDRIHPDRIRLFEAGMIRAANGWVAATKRMN